jgi:pimeloyl-ACP methyl ester carboxylesterase
MRIKVNGISLFFEVEGSKLVSDGNTFREKPTLVALHGGPGIDHADVRESLAPLSESFQIIYLDQRGNGRSEHSTPENWNLATWADDVRAFCDALEIRKPIVFGNSFGGLVALAYATQFPKHPGKLILHATTARFELEHTLKMFEQLGGPEAAKVAARFFADPTGQVFDEYRRVCLPLYRQRPLSEDGLQSIINIDVARHFVGGEWHRFDFRPLLSQISCPTLILHGGKDCIFPMECSKSLVNGIPSNLVRFEVLENCGHALLHDDPRRVRSLIESFVQCLELSQMRGHDGVAALLKE